MTRSLRARQWRELLDTAQALLADLEAGGQLLDRAAVPSRWDGFPASTTGGNGTGSDPNPFASRVAERVDYELGYPRDEDDEEQGPRRDPDQDVITEQAQAMRRQVLEALRHLRLAVGAHTRGQAKLPAHRPPAASVTECVNCARYEVISIAYKDGRCVACYGYRRRHLVPYPLDAPKDLVLARPENATRRSLARLVDPKDHHDPAPG